MSTTGFLKSLPRAMNTSNNLERWKSKLVKDFRTAIHEHNEGFVVIIARIDSSSGVEVVSKVAVIALCKPPRPYDGPLVNGE